METHLKVIRQLADGELHSGGALAERLGISRAAVWKAVHKAGEVLGLEVRSVRGRGYCLAAPLELLDPERILAEMPEEARTSDRAARGLRRHRLHQQPPHARGRKALHRPAPFVSRSAKRRARAARQDLGLPVRHQHLSLPAVALPFRAR